MQDPLIETSVLTQQSLEERLQQISPELANDPAFIECIKEIGGVLIRQRWVGLAPNDYDPAEVESNKENPVPLTEHPLVKELILKPYAEYLKQTLKLSEDEAKVLELLIVSLIVNRQFDREKSNAFVNKISQPQLIAAFIRLNELLCDQNFQLPVQKALGILFGSKNPEANLVPNIASHVSMASQLISMYAQLIILNQEAA